jgi:hypothetical protein
MNTSPVEMKGSVGISIPRERISARVETWEIELIHQYE